jgi:hypothetical protein
MMTITSRWLVLLATCVAAVVALYGFHLHLEANRFVLVPGGREALVYKLDRRTGEVWMVIATMTHRVENPDSKQGSNEERAIRLAKFFRLADSTLDLDTRMRRRLTAREGPLRVYGWKARKVGEQVYLASFTFDEGEGTEERGLYVEVNLLGEIVRLVNGDAALEENYGVMLLSERPPPGFVPRDSVPEPAPPAQAPRRKGEIPPPPPGFVRLSELPSSPAKLPPDAVLRKPDKPR